MTDLAWVFVAWPVISVLVALVVGKVIRLGDIDDEQADEQAAYARIYELRAFERRTDISPRQTQKW